MDLKKFFTNPLAVASSALVCALLWGSAFPTLKIGFKILEIEKSTGGRLYFAAYRFLIAGAMIFAGLIITRKPIFLPRVRDYGVLFLIGLFQTTIQYILFYIGLSNSTGVKASIIIGSGSFFLAILSHWLIRDDALTARKSMGLVVGFCGIVVINMGRGGFDFSFRLQGEGFLLLTAFSAALGMILVKKTAMSVYPPLMSAYQLTMGAVVLLIISISVESPEVIVFTGTSFAILLYLSFISAFAFSLWYVLVKYNQLTTMASYRFLIPVCGTLLSAAILPNEHLALVSIISLFMVSAGVILTSGRRKF